MPATTPPVNFDAQLAGRGLSRAPYLGQVATRGMIPNGKNTSNKQINTQTLLIARDDVTSPQFAFANWYSDATVHEAGSGGNITFSASVQYPIGSGTWQQIKWSGSATVVVPDGTTSPLSDAVALTTMIPRGAAFLVRVFQQADTAIVFRYQTGFPVLEYDRAEFAASGLTDKTTNNGTISASDTSTNYGPCLVVAQTRRPSVFGSGDSRMHGTGQTVTGGGDLGDVMTTLGQYFGYINCGVLSETLTGALGNMSRRLALSAYCSHIVGNYGFNDVAIGGRSAAQVIQDIATAAGLFAGKPVGWTTITPKATSTDGFTTLANQTVDSATNAPRVAICRALKQGIIPGVSFVYDIQSVYESAPESGKFAIGNGGQAICASDGVHINNLGRDMLKASGIIDPNRIRFA